MATAHPPAPFALAPLAPPRKQTRPWLAWCPRRPLLALALALLAGCGSTTPPAGVTAVTPFSLERYQGRWYEIARLDHAFERGMSDVSAFYTPQADGSVRVVNRGFHTKQNRWSEAVGKALFTGAHHRLAQGVVFWSVLWRLPRGCTRPRLPLGLGAGA